MAIRAHSEPFELSGDWFLPEAPTRTIPGVLRYATGSSILELSDSFQPVRGDITARSTVHVYPVIHGVTWDGTRATLINAHRAGFSINVMGGVMRQPERLMTTLLVLGTLASHESQYEEAQLRIPGLEAWLCRASVRPAMEQASDDRTTLNYTVMTGISEETPVPALDATLTWILEVKADDMGSPTTVSVTTSGWIRMRPTQPQPIDWYLEQRHKLITLLSFLAGVPMSDDAMSVRIQQGDASVLVGSADSRHCRLRNLREFFMPRSAMRVDLATVTARWFDVYPEVQMPVDLARSVLGSDSLWPHVEYLSLMQALEGFHRSRADGLYMDPKAYEAVKQTLGEAIPAGLAQDHKDSLRSRIRYGNEISLRKRLDGLARLLPDALRKLILGGTGTLPQSWIDTRNFYTHWDEDLRANVLDGQGMHDTNVRLRHLVRVLYLKLAGIPDQAIAECLANSLAAQDLMQLNFPSGVFMSINEEPVAPTSVAAGAGNVPTPPEPSSPNSTSPATS